MKTEVELFGGGLGYQWEVGKGQAGNEVNRSKIQFHVYENVIMKHTVQYTN